jgi:tetratricopeptide (TPR) repeat protein
MSRSILPSLTSVATIAAFTFSTYPAHACLNDRDSDSLAYEAKQLPEVTRVITGRFERNPPLFYEMRLKRVAQEIAAHPDNLLLYDDAAVACDRLGRSDEAIVWIEKKHTRLKGKPLTDPNYKEQWYRMFANRGTFRAHHWIRAGADRKHLEELQAARDDIAKAIEIKPDAHFNREKYQLKTLEWIIASRSNALNRPLLSQQLSNVGSNTAQIEGMDGLIVMGNAWESVDMFFALAQALKREELHKVGFMAELRCRELLDAGRTSLAPENFTNQSRWVGKHAQGITNPQNVEEKYKELRQEADTWQKARASYMLPLLKAGRHPDTDTTFWNGYHSTPAPSLDIPWSKEVQGNVGTRLYQFLNILPAFFLLGIILLPIFVIRLITRRVRY